MITMCKKESDALEVAGFASVSELFARYIEYKNAYNELANKVLNLERLANKLDAVGNTNCRISLENIYRPGKVINTRG